MTCSVCGNDDNDTRMGVCFDCATNGDIRLAKKSTMQHWAHGVTSLFQGVWWRARMDFKMGYRDGFDPESPGPSMNRSASYRHGFANGRDDRAGKPRDSDENLRRMADEAMELDDRNEILLDIEVRQEMENFVESGR